MFPVIVHVLAVSTMKATVSPSTGAAGSVGVEAPVMKYPLFATARNAPLWSDHGIPEVVAAIVILLDPLVIVTPVPAVRVAAAGTPAVDPMISCPLVAKEVRTGIPVAPVVKTDWFAVASPDTTLAALE